MQKDIEYIKTVSLAGNPNVGKSSIFNELTGLKQHTGNWAGKTVVLADGKYTYNDYVYKITDLPGTYSLMANSKEEICARDYICFGNSDKVVIVCDATCMERNLNLVLQTLEITDNAILCVNLIDEASKKGITVDYKKLSEILNIPVIPVCAQTKEGIEDLKKEIEADCNKKSFKVKYSDVIEKAIKYVEESLNNKITDRKLNTRWISIRLLCNDYSLVKSLCTYLQYDILKDAEIKEAIANAGIMLNENNINIEKIKDKIVSQIVMTAEGIYFDTVINECKEYNKSDRTTDKVLTNKWVAYPLMLVLLGLTFFITITGANYPSELLSRMFVFFENKLMTFALYMNVPEFLCNMLISGVFKVVGWVVSVMLPPMAIFFPLFTLLEDSGLLPRIAFNLDKIFKKCDACGKQSLTMCMGFGCNAVGVTGCRIIDSERERLIAVLTNSLVPCNGRFPTIIALITMFFIGTGKFNSLLSAIFLTIVIIAGIIMTFIVSKLLSMTILKGNPSSYTIELPPFRRPQFFKVITHSIFDRTLFVLGRAVAVAAPAGLIIWLVANIHIGNISLLNLIATALEPIGRFMGLDGVIILAFILGFPANEIVVPIMLMAYLAQGTLIDISNLENLKTVLIDNGWTILTAINTVIFSLFHFPCSTTLLTVKKETGSLKWTFLSFLIPTLCGTVICVVLKFIYNLW